MNDVLVRTLICVERFVLVTHYLKGKKYLGIGPKRIPQMPKTKWSFTRHTVKSPLMLQSDMLIGSEALSEDRMGGSFKML